MTKPSAKEYVVVDWSLHESKGGGPVRVPEGKYLLKIDSAEATTSKAGNEMIKFRYKIVSGPYDAEGNPVGNVKAQAGKTLWSNEVLTPSRLWVLEQIMRACSIAIPTKKEALDLHKFVGNELVAQVADDDPYNGVIKSAVNIPYLEPSTLQGLVRESDSSSSLLDSLSDDEDDSSLAVADFAAKAASHGNGTKTIDLDMLENA
jgi:hypothetical protein